LVDYDSTVKTLACRICNSPHHRGPGDQPSIGKEMKSQKLRETKRVHIGLIFLQSSIFI
jgi:hypothetical protein